MPTEDQSNHVFVTGAGFTRAFVPNAPLLVDDFGNDELVEKVSGLPAASRLFETERRRDRRGFIDIERLMSRLDALMPYDYENGADNEYVFLLSELKRAFLRRIDDAMAGIEIGQDVMRFTRHCVQLNATCITFNYDCYLDEALYHTDSWNPLWGYGFFCRPAYDTVAQESLEHLSPTQFNLLKLHGSINWRPRLGYTEPVALDSIVHLDRMSLFSHPIHSPNLVARHLESEPVIVPPVLSKSGLVTQPALRVVWNMAFESLLVANAVTFIGYSLPPTDISAQTLFKESLSDLPRDAIHVIDLRCNDSDRNELKARYSEVLGDIPDENFYFGGAKNWIETLPSHQESQKTL